MLPLVHRAIWSPENGHQAGYLCTTPAHPRTPQPPEGGAPWGTPTPFPGKASPIRTEPARWSALQRVTGRGTSVSSGPRLPGSDSRAVSGPLVV